MTGLFPDRLRFGIHAGQQYTTFDEYLELWRAAEDLGLDWASVFDHFMPIGAPPEGPCFEGTTLLAAMAALTSRLRVGITVTGVTYRHPAVLANIATTIDHISGGRLEFGIGGAWYELEHAQYGIAFPPIGRRLEMLGEAAQILKAMWTQPRTTFHGRHFRLEDALCEPKPVQQPRIPLWIGGDGERVTMRHVAREADGWNTRLTPLPEFDHKLAVLDDHCRAVGRDRSEIRLQVVMQAILGRDEGEAADALRRRLEALGLDPQDQRARFMFATTPEQLVERLAAYVERGVKDFLLMVRPPVDLDGLALFAREVAPALR